MNKTIEISEKTYARLSEMAAGFETPDSVIRRMLDELAGAPEQKPELIFSPANEDEFKSKLIKSKKATVIIYKNNGEQETKTWKVNRLSEDSNLRGNIWSGLMRGWKGKGIVKAEFTV